MFDAEKHSWIYSLHSLHQNASSMMKFIVFLCSLMGCNANGCSCWSNSKNRFHFKWWASYRCSFWILIVPMGAVDQNHWIGIWVSAFKCIEWLLNDYGWPLGKSYSNSTAVKQQGFLVTEARATGMNQIEAMWHKHCLYKCYSARWECTGILMVDPRIVFIFDVFFKPIVFFMFRTCRLSVNSSTVRHTAIKIDAWIVWTTSWDLSEVNGEANSLKQQIH